MKKLIFLCLAFIYLISYNNTVCSISKKPSFNCSTFWMLDEHAKMTLEILEKLTIYDSFDHKFIIWGNDELKLIVIASSLATDFWDKGQLITSQLYSFPGVVEAAIPFVNQMQKYGKKYKKPVIQILKQSADYTPYINLYIEDESGFNKYPNEVKDDLSRTQGFHFDNLFRYNKIYERWISISNWVNAKGKEFVKMENDDYKAWFVLIGLILHAVQDFYCHSNWVLIHSYYSNRINSDSIPTWEEFQDSTLNTNTKYDLKMHKRILRKMMESNDSISNSELVVDPLGKIFIKGGLQTDNCQNKLFDKNTCELLTCSPFYFPNSKYYAWEHRHPGSRNSDSSYVKLLFGNDKADKWEYEIAIELSKRASLFWINKLLNPHIIGEEKYKILLKNISNLIDTKNLDDPFTGCNYNIKDIIFTNLK